MILWPFKFPQLNVVTFHIELKFGHVGFEERPKKSESELSTKHDKAELTKRRESTTNTNQIKLFLF